MGQQYTSSRSLYAKLDQVEKEVADIKREDGIISEESDNPLDEGPQGGNLNDLSAIQGDVMKSLATFEMSESLGTQPAQLETNQDDVVSLNLTKLQESFNED